MIRSGGQDGPHLLNRFSEVVGSSEVPGEVINITEGTDDGGVVGPGPILHKYKDTANLRILGKNITLFLFFKYGVDKLDKKWKRGRSSETTNKVRTNLLKYFCNKPAD